MWRGRRAAQIQVHAHNIFITKTSAPTAIADRWDMRLSRPVVTLSLAGCVVFLGIADYLTGPDVGFSLFYLVPIVWSAWYVDRALSLALVVLASGFWLGAEVAWRGVNAVSLWNGFTRLGFTSRGVVTSSRGEQQNHELKQVTSDAGPEQLLARLMPHDIAEPPNVRR